MTSFRVPLVFAPFFALFFVLSLIIDGAVIDGAVIEGAEPEVLLLEFSTTENAKVQFPRTKELLAASAVKVKTIPLTDLENNKVSAEAGRILLIPESESFPAAAIGGLTNYLTSGGNVFFVGGDLPFTAPAIRDGERMVTRTDFFDKLKTDPHGLNINFVREGVNYQRRTYGDVSEKPATAAVIDNGKTLSVQIERYSHWDMWATTSADFSAIPAETEFLRVKVKGNMPNLSIELQEKDMSRWIASFAVQKDWDTYLLPVDAFRPWESPHRNKADDRVRFENIDLIAVGISDSHTSGVQAGASYNFALQSIEALPKGQESGNRFYPKDFTLECVAPSYKSYKLDGFMTLVSGERRFDYRGTAVSPVPRMLGLGIGMNRPWRFIPIATARNEAGGHAYPAWIMLHLDRKFKGSAVAGMGFSLETILQDRNLSAILIDIITRLGSDAFLAGAGASDFVVDTGTSFRFGGELFRTDTGMKIRAVLRNQEGTAVAEWEKPVMGNDAIAAEATLNKPGSYRCVVELIDSHNRTVDSIESEVVIQDRKPDPPSAFIRTEKDNFVIEDRYWYPNGINFFPVYIVAGMDANDFFHKGWGDRSFYDPILVEEDILNAKSVGINMLSVLMNLGNQGKFDPGAIRDFHYRCRKHGMKVNQFIGAANPLDFQEELLRQIIERARLRDDATLFCYDIIWEATNSVYRADSRERFRPEWNRWIEGQYGNKENAVKDWKFDPGTNEAGLISPPTDEQFIRDGDHRVYVAVYRRFMDDHTAKLWQQAVDRLRLMDPCHLITNRAGNIHPYDNAFTGPVKALDFISPEGYAIQEGEAAEGAIGFANRVIDFYSGGKPIVWSEFGKPAFWGEVGGADAAAIAAAIERCGDYNEMFYRRSLEAGAQGFAPWWWSGGYRVDEHSDFGIINVDGTHRKTAEVVKQYADQIQTQRQRQAGSIPFDFDPDEHAGGYTELIFGKGSAAYLDAASEGKMLSFRNEAVGKTSVNVPIRGVGNVPYTGSNPVKYLNGFFEKVEYKNASGQWIEIGDSAAFQHNGQLELRVRVANMGEVPFIATSGVGGVFVRVAQGGQVLLFPITSDVPRLNDLTVANMKIPAQWSGTFSLRLEAKDRAVFGNEFRLTVCR